MCPRAISEFGNKDIDFALFHKIIDEGCHFAESAVLYGGGEPLLNPEIFRMIRYCKEKNLRTEISTNATLLKGDTIEEIFDSGLDYIILAFDGATPEVYEKYRKGAKFEITRRNILNFLQRKKERNSSLTVIIQMVRLPENQHQIKDFMKLWNIKGVDSIRIKEDEICIDGVSLNDRKKRALRRNPCHLLWQGPLFISENGDVYPCCYMWRSEPVGNLQKESLLQIWNNKKMMAIRDAHIKKNLSGYPDCISCKAASPRLGLIIGSFLTDPYRVRRIIPLIEKLSLIHKIPFFDR